MGRHQQGEPCWAVQYSFYPHRLSPGHGLVPAGVVCQAYLLFPPPIVELVRHKEDPLPESTIRDLHRVLIDGASFHLVTDSPTFFRVKIDLIESTGLFEQVAVSRDFEGGLTWYQQFWEKLDYESHRVEFRKIQRA